MKRGLDWRNLQFFLAVARSGSLSEAGRLMGVDHVTVARHITSLEESVGKILFERHQRGYALTRYGEDLLAVAEEIDQKALQIPQANSPASGLAGIVRISSLEGFSNFFLARRIASLLSSHPTLTVELLTIQQIIALSRRQADIAVTVTPSSDNRFICEKLTAYTLGIYATRDYLSREKPIRKPSDISDHLFAGYVDEMIFMRELDYLEELGVSRRMVRIQNSSVQAQMAAVRSGVCLSALPSFVATGCPDLVRVLPDELKIQRHYWLNLRADEQSVPRIKYLCDFIRQEVEKEKECFLS